MPRLGTRGWLIALMLAVLVASQAVILTTLMTERRIDAQASHRQATFRRVDWIVEWRASQPAGAPRDDSATGQGFLYFTSDVPSVAREQIDESATALLRDILAGRAVQEVRVARRGEAGRPPARPELRQTPAMQHDPSVQLWASVALPDGLWANVVSISPTRWGFTPSIGIAVLASTLASAFGVTVAAVATARRFTRPLERLAAAAEKVGRSPELERAPEEGPEDLRRVAREFNSMAERVRRMLDEQQLLLRAIGHDLRTPLASLRIRLEFVEDGELRERMSATLAEMEQLTAIALDAARGGAVHEPVRRIELSALVSAVCEDAAELGRPVTLVDTQEADVLGRSSELRRAVQNLIDNAVLHGGGACVRVMAERNQAVVVVEDDGPGIPEADLRRVTEPFVRLDPSRNAEAGGHGLGLTIVKAIAERHSGSLTLTNRPEGGVCAALRLPRERAGGQS